MTASPLFSKGGKMSKKYNVKLTERHNKKDASRKAKHPKED